MLIADRQIIFVARATPFRLGVTFDDSEEATGTISEGTSDQHGRPGGITGISFNFKYFADQEKSYFENLLSLQAFPYISSKELAKQSQR